MNDSSQLPERHVTRYPVFRLGLRFGIKTKKVDRGCGERRGTEMALGSMKWGYVRIISGTLLGGALGFYVMHRLEVSYKEKMKERLRQYEIEMKKKEQLNQLDESL